MKTRDLPHDVSCGRLQVHTVRRRLPSATESACAAPANDIAPAAMLAIKAPRFTQFSSLEIQRRYGARRSSRL